MIDVEDKWVAGVAAEGKGLVFQRGEVLMTGAKRWSHVMALRWLYGMARRYEVGLGGYG